MTNTEATITVDSDINDRTAYAIAMVEKLFPSDEEQAKIAVVFQRWAAEMDFHSKKDTGKGIHELSGFEQTLEEWCESNLS